MAESTEPPAAAPARRCRMDGCKRPYRAKGYCRTHYQAWRRGELPKARFKTCSRPECRKRVVAHGLCAEHQKKGAAEGAPR